jgi:uncharacterized protein
MQRDTPDVTFDRLTTLDGEAQTLVEGLPGHGLVAAIAVDQLTTQLGLDHHGNVVSDAFPPVTSFKDGRVRDAVRVYAGDDPPVMTLQSDVALPEASLDALSRCILDDLTAEFDRAVFIAGAPAESEEEIGEVFGVATTAAVEEQLRAAGVALGDGQGLVGGVTGALATACYHDGVPAAVLVVKANPFLPDPGAARALIDDALEPLVEFDVDTTALAEQADEIRAQMEQIAQRYQQLLEGAESDAEDRIGPTMYQ